MSREKQFDALLAAAIKTVEELEALVAMLGAFGDEKEEPRRISLAAALREIAALFDSLPLAANDLVVIKRRLRGLMSTDPDKTPRAVSVKDLQAVEPPDQETRFEPVEEPRKLTRPGLGAVKPPLPKRER